MGLLIRGEKVNERTNKSLQKSKQTKRSMLVGKLKKCLVSERKWLTQKESVLVIRTSLVSLFELGESSSFEDKSVVHQHEPEKLR